MGTHPESVSCTRQGREMQALLQAMYVERDQQNRLWESTQSQAEHLENILERYASEHAAIAGALPFFQSSSDRLATHRDATLANLIGGITLFIEQPFKIGERYPGEQS